MPIITHLNGKLNYLDRGTGKPLVFIHGLGANLSFYDPQFEFFVGPTGSFYGPD
ncbi:MAG: alpha/beta fold hydrolase [Desulfitobacterium sp.]